MMNRWLFPLSKEVELTVESAGPELGASSGADVKNAVLSNGRQFESPRLFVARARPSWGTRTTLDTYEELDLGGLLLPGDSHEHIPPREKKKKKKKKSVAVGGTPSAKTRWHQLFNTRSPPGGNPLFFLFF
eukprot:FR742576.1.p3 GENE.FR742576.1~~FR742576.1.p3  ORF type:complete len:131 (+),score=41.63 FR742576.1:558-950(+)